MLLRVMALGVTCRPFRLLHGHVQSARRAAAGRVEHQPLGEELRAAQRRVGRSSELTPRGRYQLSKIVRRLEFTPAPVKIQISPNNPELDAARQKRVVEQLSARVLRGGLDPGVFLNVNFPEGRPQGVRVTRQGTRRYRATALERIDPAGPSKSNTPPPTYFTCMKSGPGWTLCWRAKTARNWPKPASVS